MMQIVEPLQVAVADRERDDVRDEVAWIWAQATAHRDGDADIAPLAEARPVIDAVLDGSRESILLLATSRPHDGAPVGFAAISPDAQGNAEIRYLGVRPAAWGHGVAGSLLSAMPAVLLDVGFAEAVLSVYVDNAPAVAAYRRAGWSAIGRPMPHPHTGRLQQRYRLSVRSE